MKTKTNSNSLEKRLPSFYTYNDFNLPLVSRITDMAMVMVMVMVFNQAFNQAFNDTFNDTFNGKIRTF